VGENFGELQAKLHLAKKTSADLSPASIAFSDFTSNWRIKLRRIHSKSPNSPKFSPIRKTDNSVPCLVKQLHN